MAPITFYRVSGCVPPCCFVTFDVAGSAVESGECAVGLVFAVVPSLFDGLKALHPLSSSSPLPVRAGIEDDLISGFCRDGAPFVEYNGARPEFAPTCLRDRFA